MTRAPHFLSLFGDKFKMRENLIALTGAFPCFIPEIATAAAAAAAVAANISVLREISCPRNAPHDAYPCEHGTD